MKLHPIPLIVLLMTSILFIRPARADADVTAFWGLSPTPVTHAARGFSIGFSLLVVGFEFEYANLAENALDDAPGLTTGMINGVVQTPTSKTQFYLTAGGGFYRESLGTDSESSFGTNLGGGIKIGLVGPLRLRLDYRVFNLRGSPVQGTPQRFYAGVNFMF